MKYFLEKFDFLEQKDRHIIELDELQHLKFQNYFELIEQKVGDTAPHTPDIIRSFIYILLNELDDFTSGKAKAAFEEDLFTTAQFRAHGYPNFLIRYGEKSTLLRGYQNFNNFKAIINQVTNGEIKENKVIPTEENVRDFITKYQSVAPAELKMAFDLLELEFKKVQNALLEHQFITKREAGNGYFLSPKNNPMACDMETGVCRQ